MTPKIWRIPADISLPAFILEINLRLVERRAEQIVGTELHACSGRRADAQPIEPQSIATSDPVFRFERQKLGQGQLLARDRARRTDTPR